MLPWWCCGSAEGLHNERRALAKVCDINLPSTSGKVRIGIPPTGALMLTLNERTPCDHRCIYPRFIRLLDSLPTVESDSLLPLLLLLSTPPPSPPRLTSVGGTEENSVSNGRLVAGLHARRCCSRALRKTGARTDQVSGPVRNRHVSLLSDVGRT